MAQVESPKESQGGATATFVPGAGFAVRRMDKHRHPLDARVITQSMSRRGNYLDNASMESFFGTLKSKYFYLNRFGSIEDLVVGLKDYIRYDNHDRIKLDLKGQSPVDYRKRFVSI
jgi:putative transposase